MSESMRQTVHSAESVCPGHPDKVCDYIADAVLDAHLEQDPESRVACEVLCKSNLVVGFVHGGPAVDCGVTGRKLMVDSYGTPAHHGGGAFSGKDPSKVDRSGAYFARFVARQVIKTGRAARAEVTVAYAIGRAEPVAISIDTYGTGDDEAVAAWVRREFDFRPAAIVARLGLLAPIHRRTTNHGHFGRPGLPWEA